MKNKILRAKHRESGPGSCRISSVMCGRSSEVATTVRTWWLLLGALVACVCSRFLAEGVGGGGKWGAEGV